MAVRPTTASDRRPRTSGDPGTVRIPIRTCIGCRQTAAAAEMLRVVVARTSSGTVLDPVLVVPDPDRSAPGRGAWLHQSLECAQLAQRRRAFARALRVPAALDPTAVLERLGNIVGAQGSNGSKSSTGSSSGQHPVRDGRE